MVNRFFPWWEKVESHGISFGCMTQDLIVAAQYNAEDAGDGECILRVVLLLGSADIQSS